MIKNRTLGIIVVLIQLITSIIFMLFLYQIKLLPNKFLFMAIGVLLFITFIVFLFTKNYKQKKRFSIGIILVIINVIVYVLGGIYISKGINTLVNITNKTTIEQSSIGIYVKNNDQANSIIDIKDYTFGILETLDKENTDLAIKEINTIIGDINTKEYAGITELIDGFLDKQEIEAIILNNEFLSLLSEIEGYENIEEQLKEVHIEQIETKHEIESIEKNINIITVYVSGIDSRSGLIAKSRSDVNIIMVINRETHQVILISTPRDYYVPLSISNGVPDKLTHAGIYGVDVSRETLEMLYQIEIDYYFRVNFNGFEKIIDALGGITVISDYSFNSKNVPGYSFVKGENFVDGKEALAFVRERYSFGEGDRQRGKNQLAVMEGVIKKAMSPALLKNYFEIMESLEGSFETNIPYDVIAEVVRKQLDEGGEWNIVSYSVDGTGASKRPYSMNANAYVMIPDMDTVNVAIDKINKIKDGEILE